MKKKSVNWQEIVQKLSRAIAYEFKDPTLLLTAITHKSKKLSSEDFIHGHNNERLEFLGDAVLSLISAEYFYKLKNKFHEGDLSRLRAQFVCQNHLSESGKRLKLKDFISSDSAMRRSGTNNSPAVLADTMEAIIGAVYIDGGLESARHVVFNILGIPSSNLEQAVKDPKTELQEILQSRSCKSSAQYVLISSTGPAHAPHFEVAVKLDGEIIAQASGENKRSAAQNAAKEALKHIAKIL